MLNHYISIEPAPLKIKTSSITNKIKFVIKYIYGRAITTS